MVNINKQMLINEFSCLLKALVLTGDCSKYVHPGSSHVHAGDPI